MNMQDALATPQTVLCPVPVTERAVGTLAPRATRIEGLRIGFLGNLKPNCDVLLRTTEAEMLKAGARATLFREKASCSLGAPAAMLDEIAATCEAAVVALGD